MSTSALAAVLAKFAGLDLAGKAIVGAVVAAGAVGAATGVPAIASDLTSPPATQQGSTVAPTTDPTGTPSAEATEPTADPTGQAEPTQDPTEPAGTRPTDLPTAAAFGQKVAAEARAGGVDGQTISTEAHARNALRQGAGVGASGDVHGKSDAREPMTAPTGAPTTAPSTLPTNVPTGMPTARR
ncbi:MAG: hypothetical protein ACYCTH_06545 [Cellulomonas sp.]